MESILPALASIFFILLGLFILVMTILMPVYVWLIYRQGVAAKRALDGYSDGFNKVLAALYHIQQNTTPVQKKNPPNLPEIKLH